MKRIIFVLLSALLLASCQEKKVDRFVREVQNLSKSKCPLIMDEITVLDSLVFTPGGRCGTFSQYHTLTMDDSQKEAFNTIKSEIIDSQKKLIRNSVEYVEFKNEGVDFEYIFNDNTTHAVLLQFTITAEDYKK